MSNALLAHVNDSNAQSMMGMMNWMMGSKGAFTGWGFLGGTIFILFWILILVILVLLIIFLIKQIQK